MVAQPKLAGLVRPELERGARLAADLVALDGPDWAQRATLTAATQRYVGRLDQVAASPVGYLAHAYTRYLGDLSGGQVVRTMLVRHYGLGDSELSFCRFDGIDKVKPYKDDYRAALDAVPLSLSERDAVVDEAVLAFELNSDLFADWASGTRPATEPTGRWRRRWTPAVRVRPGANAGRSRPPARGARRSVR